MKIKFDCEFLVKIILVLGVIYLMIKCCTEKSLEKMGNIKMEGLKNLVLSKDNKKYVLARTTENNEVKFVDVEKIVELENWLAIRFKVIKINDSLFRLENQNGEKTLVKLKDSKKVGFSEEENNIIFFRYEKTDEEKVINYFDMNVKKIKKRIPNENKIVFQNKDTNFVLASGKEENVIKEAFLLNKDLEEDKSSIDDFNSSWKIHIRDNIF